MWAWMEKDEKRAEEAYFATAIALTVALILGGIFLL